MDHNELYKLLIDKEQSLRFIANRISKKIERKLQGNEIRELVKCIKAWSKQYADQVEDEDDEDELKDIRIDIANRYRKILKTRYKPAVSEMDTHEMMKSQLFEDNIKIHEASGYSELKYQDEYCEDGQGNMSSVKFGGPSGNDKGIFGEQPVIASEGGRPKTIRAIRENEPDSEDENPKLDENGNIVQDDKIRELLAESSVHSEDIKLYTQKIQDMVEYFYKKDKKSLETPADTDPDKIHFRDAYLQFDTRFRDLTFTFDDNTGQYRWAVSNIPFLQADGSVGVIFELSDIIEMEIEAFYVPLDNTFYNFYNRITLFIEEINTQAVMSSENTRYHWNFDTEIVGNRLLLTPVRRKMIFKDPIRFLNQTTFTLRSPFQLIPFCKDRMPATSTPGTNPALFTTAEPHCLTSNDLIYFVGVNTGDATISSLLNDDRGLQITKINGTQFTVPVDFTTIAVPITTVPYFGSKRVVIPIRFRCLSRGIETNFLKAVGEHFM